MNELLAAVVSVTMTKRRRYFWAVWTTAAPQRAPFRKPDASGGGAPTREAALAEAASASGYTALSEIEPEWARAWIRVMRGHAPWEGAGSYPGARRSGASAGGKGEGESIWVTLGVSPTVSPEELKAAFRRRSLATHPDHGGDPDAFRRVVVAYREAERRIRKPRRKRP